MNLIKKLWKDEEAATVVEYAILAAVIGVALIGTLVVFRNSIRAMLQRASDTIRNPG